MNENRTFETNTRQGFAGPPGALNIPSVGPLGRVVSSRSSRRNTRRPIMVFPSRVAIAFLASSELLKLKMPQPFEFPSAVFSTSALTTSPA
jgi:hypothetical protein